jgi:predicted ATPase
MAHVRRIQIDNYRSIDHLDIDLSPGPGQPFRHLILTGPNGSGKSSALELVVRELRREGGIRNQWCQLQLDSPLTLSAKDRQVEQLVAFFRAQRLLEVLNVSGPTKIDWKELISTSAARAAPQFLVNRKVEQSFARDDGDRATVAAIEGWFADLRDHLAHLLEDPGLSLQFDRKSFTVRFRYGDGREVAFAELAQGHSAALNIFFELLIQSHARREAFGVPPERLAGIVLVDEIETHLHLRLQELILPFLTEIFPTFQFIVATHSPAVIASIPDAVVYDLGKREAVASEDLQGIRYGTLMTHHFGIAADMDLDSTARLQRLRALAIQPRTSEEDAELAELAGTLSDRSPTLKLEVWKALNPSPAGGAR